MDRPTAALSHEIPTLAELRRTASVWSARMMTFEQLTSRLEPSTLDLLCRMAEMHLGTSGDRRFLLASAFGGDSLLFTDGKRSEEFDVDDAGALRELAAYGLLTTERAGRDPAFRVSADGRAFYRWLRERDGNALAQVDANTRRLVESDQFGRAHPSAAYHLNEAFSLLWADRSDPAAASEIGGHLRSAVMDVVTDVVGHAVPGRSEDPAGALNTWLSEQASLQVREIESLQALVTLVSKVVRLDNRAAHVRDESDKGLPLPTRDELRRAAFLTTVVCSEVAAIA